jgi:acetolactate synthase-1/2/3 large subunit
MWTMQYLQMNENSRLLTSGGLGTMGYGFPAAIGAKLGNPDRDVICISGDGGFQMNLQELATAMAQELPIIVCIFNNGYLGMVRQWQELFYEQRYAGTCMRYRKSCRNNCNDSSKQCPPYLPDFVALAESYGAKGIRVTKEEEIVRAFETAKQNNNTPTIIEFIIDSSNLVLPMVQSGKALSDMISNV